MRRRSRAGGEPVKTRRRKMAARKRGNAPKVARRQGSSAASLQTKVARLTHERDEALEQRTATAEVLKIISTSPTELQAVLEVVVRSAARFCEADDVTIFEFDGQDLRAAAHWGMIPVEIGLRFPCTRGSVAGRIVLERRPVHVIDLQAEAKEFPEGSAMARRLGHRTIAGVPLLREGAAVGTIQLRRTEVNPFTDKQIALLETFAAQAVIAIENVRLFEAEQQRTRELSESLEQQTATSEVLKVISSSPGELKPVFNAMLENAVRLCEAELGHLFLYDGEVFHAAALHSASQAFAEVRRRPVVLRELHPDNPLAVITRTKAVVHTADVRTEKSYIERDPSFSEFVDVSGARAVLLVPMLKENELIGAFTIYRLEVRQFTDKQIELVKNFAAQAVIAIENARLLNELRQRTDDLTELLEQQTATAEVLRVISSSPGELELVFEAMLTNAVRLCEAKFGVLYLYDEGRLRVGAAHDVPPAFAEARGKEPFTPAPDASTGKVVTTKQAVQIADLAATQSYSDRNPVVVTAVEVGGVRTSLSVPMLKENALVGVISIYRKEVRPFTEKQTALLENFAAQAVIAIENTRLLNELRQRTADLTESLDQQTATSQVLQVISSSPGDLEPVFASMLENAVRICDAKFGNIYRWEDDALHLVASHNTPPAFARARRRSPFNRAATNAVISRLLATKAAVHVADAAAQPGYIDRSDHGAVAAVELGGVRTALAVPMLQENELIGSFTVYRQEVRPFTDKQIALVTNFAAQAVIAIENTRLLNELRRSLEQQTATADVLKTISRSTFDLQTVLDTLVQSAARLCRADQSGIRLAKDGLYYNVASHGYSPEHKARMELETFKVDRSSVVGRVVLDAKSVHLIDSQADPNPELVNRSQSGNIRTLLGVPLQREGMPIGVLLLQRTIVQPFTDEEIGLAETFADQAVIAIENVRLFEAEQQRTRELSESLEQQTATADVLGVISSSPGELEPVFRAMLENATRICGAKFGNLWLAKDGGFQLAATHGLPPEFQDQVQRKLVLYPGPTLPIARAASTREPVHISRPAHGPFLRRARANRHSWCRTRPGADDGCCSHAEGSRYRRRIRHLTPGGTAIRRQAN